ncbi:MAG: hypothetical protein CL940_01535 [Deltaproteobacteria bacterium]|nr:hypothetical protein [Deltaproteobacteria bacterium]
MAALMLMLGGVNPAFAKGAEEALTSADEAFRFQDYAKTIELLQPLVDQDKIKDDQARHQVLERLAASYWFTDDHDAARTLFGALLKEVPGHQLDPLFYPQELVTFFKNEKQRLAGLGFIGRGDTSGGNEGPRFTLVEREIRRTYPTAAYFMPFGLPQMLGERGSSGTLHAALQGLGLATNVAAWLRIESLKQEGSRVIPKSDGSEAELLERVWWVGTGVLAASYVYSVVDGLLNRLPPVEMKRSYKVVDPDAPPPDAEPDSAWRVVPANQGFGLSIAAEF